MSESTSESENPAIDAPEPKTSGRPQSNQDWWPNQLDLSVLHQHSERGNPLDRDFDYVEEFEGLDVEALKADIVGAVRAQLGAVSRQAVYDALAVFTDKGLVRRIQPAGSPARYEDRVGDNHHHLICRSCDRMTDVDCAVGYTPCLTAADASGYEIDEAEVIYWGRCPGCASAA